MRIIFASAAFDDFLHWQTEDPAIHARILALITDIRRKPFTGLGKPEPLKQALSGWWSRRIDQEHRIVYRIRGEERDLEILSVRYHY